MRLGRPISQDLEELILQCLEKDRDQRPASAEALRQALRACGEASTWGEEAAHAWWTTGPGAEAWAAQKEASTGEDVQLPDFAVALEDRVSDAT